MLECVNAKGQPCLKVTEGPVFELDVALPVNVKSATDFWIGLEIVTQVQAEAPATWLVTGWMVLLGKKKIQATKWLFEKQANILGENSLNMHLVLHSSSVKYLPYMVLFVH